MGNEPRYYATDATTVCFAPRPPQAPAPKPALPHSACCCGYLPSATATHGEHGLPVLNVPCKVCNKEARR